MSFKFIIIVLLVENGVVDRYQHTIGQFFLTEAIVYILFSYEGGGESLECKLSQKLREVQINHE